MPLSNLNEEQYEAATCKNGFNLIIASAGTGKTSTIVGRIAYLINSGVKPEEILLLTFTNKAAAEMVSRVAKFFGKELAKKIVAGTFHSVSYKLLKELNQNITLKQPNELKTLFKSVYEKRVFMNRSEADPYDGGYLYDLYSLYLNSHDTETFGEWLKLRSEHHELYIPIYEDVFEEFNELKDKYGYVNFDDLLLLMNQTLEENYFEFKEILVDEYQDTNPLQGKLLNNFKPNSLFCVGDYDQSIYAFNGSDIGIISSFENRYENATVYTLRKNYRSTKPILDLATKVIEHNIRVYEKSLEVVRDDDLAAPPKLLVFNELFEQYEYIAKQIGSSITPHNDIAIIFRNNSAADGVEANLREYGIPAKRKGGHSFFDSLEVKVMLDLITLVVNHNDMMAFIHLVEYGKGIGKAIAKELFEALLKVGENDVFKGLFDPNSDINPYEKAAQKNVQLGLFDDFLELGSVSKFKNSGFEERFLSNPILKHPKLSVDGGEFLYDLYKLLKELKRVRNPKSMIEHIEKSGFFLRIKELLSTKRATLKDGSLDSDLQESAVQKIERKVFVLKTLSRHYDDVYRFINAMVLGGGEMSEGDGVNLLTVHASKGLEFKEVYVIDLAEGRFPNRKLISKGGSLDEERRLFYVAVTRARDTLYLSYAKYDKIKKMDFVPSIFLKEAGLVK